MEDLIQKLFDAIESCTDKKTKDVDYKLLALLYFDIINGKT